MLRNWMNVEWSKEKKCVNRSYESLLYQISYTYIYIYIKKKKIKAKNCYIVIKSVIIFVHKVKARTLESGSRYSCLVCGCRFLDKRKLELASHLENVSFTFVNIQIHYQLCLLQLFFSFTLSLNTINRKSEKQWILYQKNFPILIKRIPYFLKTFKK